MLDQKNVFGSVFVAIVSFLSILVGALVVCQASMNIKLALTLGQGIRASCVSFWVGFFGLLTILMLARFNNASLQASNLEMTCFSFANIRYYHLAGACGAFYVTTAAVSVPLIGFAVFFVCLVCGQLAAALYLDKTGSLGTIQVFIKPGRYIGCVLTACGAILILLASGSSIGAHPGIVAVLILCSVGSGVALPVQAALNNLFKTETSFSTLSVVCVSFLVGALCLSVLSGFSYLIFPATFIESNNEWWHWFGGLVGVAFVSAAVKFPPIIGYSTFFVAMIAGQLLTSLLSDTYGLLGPPKESARDPLTIVGVVLAGVGVALVSVFKNDQASARGYESTVTSAAAAAVDSAGVSDAVGTTEDKNVVSELEIVEFEEDASCLENGNSENGQKSFKVANI